MFNDWEQFDSLLPFFLLSVYSIFQCPYLSSHFSLLFPLLKSSSTALHHLPLTHTKSWRFCPWIEKCQQKGRCQWPGLTCLFLLHSLQFPSLPPHFRLLLSLSPFLYRLRFLFLTICDKWIENLKGTSWQYLPSLSISSLLQTRQWIFSSSWKQEWKTWKERRDKKIGIERRKILKGWLESQTWTVQQNPSLYPFTERDNEGCWWEDRFEDFTFYVDSPLKYTDSDAERRER